MGTLVQPTFISTPYRTITKNVSSWENFIKWCDRQEEYKLGWLAAALMLHGCVLTIITMFAIITTGNHFIFWPFTIGAMGMCLVTNLAAMPTRVTIPVFFLSVLIDLLIIIICLFIGFDIGKTII